jgi:hypothetical protein
MDIPPPFAVAFMLLVAAWVLSWAWWYHTRTRGLIEDWARANGAAVLVIREARWREFRRYFEGPSQRVYFVRLRWPDGSRRSAFVVCGSPVPNPMSKDLLIHWLDAGGAGTPRVERF